MLVSARRASPGVRSMLRIDHLRDIAAQCDGMLIDQFGVIHDGEKPYPGVLDLLDELKQSGIPVVVITNSGKRADANHQRLAGMGIGRDFYVDVVSSGEVAYQQMSAGPPRRAYIIGRDGDDYGFDNVTIVDTPRDAEIILILGSNAPVTSLEQYRELLKGCALPALCCNPDKLMLTRHGLQPAPGAIAALYEQLGGKVDWIGKPYPGIYRHALRLIGNPKKALAIGDSAEHDVAGGRGAGLATLLVRTGISTGLETFEPQPDYLMDRLIW
jgi:HAD superfamily hydrolase (TIGR01459 family)